MSMLTEILTKEQREAGFYLQDDDLLVYLMKKGVDFPLSVFGHNVTLKELIHEADQHLNWIKSGIETTGEKNNV